ncbi:MAG: iron ABC transporter permease [Anaerolineales bacterium]|nr:iron ABC transporter permease [Anaerolineales bacterium]
MSSAVTSAALQKAITRNHIQQRIFLWLGLGLVVFSLVSLLWGRYPSVGLISWQQLNQDELARLLVINLRLPRLLTALLVGISLSASGTVFQMLFGNPLVEPGFLGVSQGAAFGAALCIVFLGGSAAMVQGIAVVFAFCGLGASYLLARRIRYGGWVLRLVLSGIAISALFSAGLGVLKYMADPLRQLPEITFWLLGGLSSITWAQFLSILPATLIGLVLLFLFRWRLNLLALNEETAFSMGAAPKRERLLLLTAAVLPTAAVVSVAGMIGWVGLIMPHIARRLFGSDTRFTLPASMLLGGIFVTLCDDLSRTLLAGEIPLGILTSLLGATIFIVLMVSRGVKVER